MTFFVLATVRPAPPPAHTGPLDLRNLWLESWDGSVMIPIGGATHRGPVQLQVEASGLEEAPTDVTIDGVPGVPGGIAVFSRTLVREPLLPLLINTTDQVEQRAVVQELRDLVVSSEGKLTPDGSFRLVCSTPSGTRQVGLVYQSGLEGTGTELPWSVLHVLDCAAPQPFAEDRADSVLPFALGGGADRFLAVDQDDAGAPNFEDAALAPDAVLGEDMPVVITSEVAPYATFEVVGPTGPGVVLSADTGLLLNIPTGVDAGSRLRIVTDPRRKSIRLTVGDGPSTPAAGMLARGSRLRPLAFGTNKLSITAPGATEETQLLLSWRGKYRSMW